MKFSGKKFIFILILPLLITALAHAAEPKQSSFFQRVCTYLTNWFVKKTTEIAQDQTREGFRDYVVSLAQLAKHYLAEKKVTLHLPNDKQD